MEDMARLALVEQSVRDADKFNDILYEVLRHFNNILENPHDYELRTIKSDILKKCLELEAFGDYMKYVGFTPEADSLTYPKEFSLSKLRIAQATIERKLNYCCGPLDSSRVDIKPARQPWQPKKTVLKASNVLKTENPFLRKIESLFNNVIKYEDEKLQELARQHIPIATLQLMAIDRVREHQRKLKTGEIKGRDQPFDVALLMELLSWFKHKFFTWVDKPACKRCGEGTTIFIGTNSMVADETCNMEIYECIQCGAEAFFPRFDDPRTLLRSRKGRCGEWANCFALLCRALGYDTRYIYDVTDHVWCEVFDYDSNTWLHVDPCEALLNAPLTYSHGWKKKLSYVIAVSRDDVQDVTWRYTTNHKEVLSRRNMCTEDELISTLIVLRENRQRQVSEPRRRYLAKRTLQEIVSLMVEKEPSDYESHGRISGSKEWRSQRGEIGTDKGHIFNFNEPGIHIIRYYPTMDEYRVSCDGKEKFMITGWDHGAFQNKNLFKKTENDWRKVYLAREEDAKEGFVSWKLTTIAGCVCKSLNLSAVSAKYEGGHIDWTICFDQSEPLSVTLTDAPMTFEQDFSSVVIKANLSGGIGDVAWQKAQLFRQSLDNKSSTLEIIVVVEKTK